MSENSNLLYGVILAGGSGSRLWPLSRDMYPKQLLKLKEDEQTLFQQTFSRLVETIDDKNILSVTNIKHESTVRMQLDELSEIFCRKSSYQMVTEPIGRNTAPALALAVKYVKSLAGKGKDPIILVTPSDHLVLDKKAFSKTIKKGVQLARSGKIVTFGISPQKPDTGFGYIKTKTDKRLKDIAEGALKVSEFTEKPDLQTAQEFIKSGKYYWNSGIFMFRASTMLAELKKYAHEIYDILKDIEILKTSPSVTYQEFEKMPDISIDYAVMEKSKKVALLPLECAWNDLGSWEAIYDVSKKDKNGNCFFGNVIDVDSKNSMIYSTSNLVTTIGLNNIVVVETEDAILVCDKSRTQDVKKIYNKLKDKNDDTHHIHKTVYKPWGYYSVMQQGDGFLTKCISVNPNAKLSLQTHQHRSEHWVVLEGKARVIKGELTYELSSGESIDIGVKEVHSLQNPYEKTLKILEVQKGKILDEKDIIRLEDIYGRA